MSDIGTAPERKCARCKDYVSLCYCPIGTRVGFLEEVTVHEQNTTLEGSERRTSVPAHPAVDYDALAGRDATLISAVTAHAREVWLKVNALFDSHYEDDDEDNPDARSLRIITQQVAIIAAALLAATREAEQEYAEKLLLYGAALQRDWSEAKDVAEKRTAAAEAKADVLDGMVSGRDKALQELAALHDIASASLGVAEAKLSRQAETIHARQESWRQMRDQLAAAEAKANTARQEQEQRDSVIDTYYKPQLNAAHAEMDRLRGVVNAARREQRERDVIEIEAAYKRGWDARALDYP